MAGRSRTARRARSAVAAAILLGASLAVLLAAPPAHASGQVAEDVDGIWECAVAIAIVEDLGQTLAVSSSYVLDDFHAITEDSEALEESADAALRRYWTGLAAQRGQAWLEAYVIETAEDCANLYQQANATQQQAAGPAQPAVEQQLNAAGTLSAAALRSYATRTGDLGEVANYLVYHYPYGKDLFQPNEDGDLLGQLIVEAGEAGLRRWSDEAIYAIANAHYWQYNPPATRLVFAEYRRRMRMMRQSESEAQRWAQRAADDRAEKARQANASYVGSLGTGKAYKPKPGSGVVVCTTHKGTGGGRVCKEE